MSPSTVRRKPPQLDLEVLAAAAECLRTLAHPHRLRIVEMLLTGEYTVGQLADACGIASHVASGHLRLMQHCGLLQQRREGRNIYYQVCEPCLGDFLACIAKRFGKGT
jgi:ArsR family transcriptional regulator, zinc-responsive transcriptional repressor